MNKSILFVLKHFSVSGGVEKVTLNLAYQFKSEGHTVSFFVMDGKGVPETLNNDFEVFISRNAGIKGILFLLPKLIKWIRQHKVSAVISAKEQANILTFAASLFNRRFVPIYTRHCAFDVSDQELSVASLKKLYRLYSFGRGKIVAVSKDLAKYIKEQLSGSVKNVEFCPNPVVSQALIDKAEINSDDFHHCRPYFCAVGRLCEQKGFDMLLESYAKACSEEANFPDLVIVGEGEHQDKLKSLALALNINDKVKFNGFTTNPYYIVKNSEMFLLSSRHEGLPTVLIEALALQKKIVAYDCPTGPREILDNGKYGTLVSPGNVELFAKAMLESYRQSSEVPSEAVKRYTYPVSAASYLALMD